MYSAFYIGCLRTRQERFHESLGATGSLRQLTVLRGCVAIGLGFLVVPPAWSASRCL
jgi:hypothetical protein